jgi:hypothetical protein
MPKVDICRLLELIEQHGVTNALFEATVPNAGALLSGRYPLRQAA